eukprot:CAMPEP_0198202370 /NCGR_PEP_ID=MMETSP1445-20131203/5516_1 /TAXON_ID=36898 /ORGANISM="Pyramimonas sp., Strain CCMP2087" /LENGTH=121 /DNA_ID=CAMNT_0043873243 /DNA_START=178 /DNA_END=543 /DNA_ORIENTATION=-
MESKPHSMEPPTVDAQPAHPQESKPRSMEPLTAYAQQQQQQPYQGQPMMAPMAQPMTAMAQPMMAMAQPTMIVQQPQMVMQKYCGPMTFCIGIFLFPFVCCCPCDTRLVPAGTPPPGPCGC